MVQWIEIPAHRILAVPSEDYRELFEQFTEDGKKPVVGEAAYQIRRKRDGKLFRLARFTPAGELFNRIFLEEW